MATNFRFSKLRSDFKTAIAGAASAASTPDLELVAGRILLGWQTRLISSTVGACGDAKASGPFAVIGPVSSARLHPLLCVRAP